MVNNNNQEATDLRGIVGAVRGRGPRHALVVPGFRANSERVVSRHRIMYVQEVSSTFIYRLAIRKRTSFCTYIIIIFV